MSNHYHILQHQNNIIKQLQRKTQDLQQWNGWLQQVLSPSLQPLCQVANFRDECLIIELNDSTIATMLRFQAPELQQQLQQVSQRRIKRIKYLIQGMEVKP